MTFAPTVHHLMRFGVAIDDSCHMLEWTDSRGRLILEFGERLDLEQLTRDVMTAVETDVSRALEWAAVIHRNTEHPHVLISELPALSLKKTTCKRRILTC